MLPIKMGLDRDLLGRVRELDEFDLRRLQLFTREVLTARTGAAAEAPAPVGSRGSPRETFRRQRVRCGKSGCRSCPHGPYWYAYWREEGRLRSRYVGKERPPEASPARTDRRQENPPFGL
jgi:hypothetical protein